MKEITTYKRKAALADLKDFCIMAKESDFIEVTKWKNGEGFEVCIESGNGEFFQLTYGQFKALKKLIKILDK